MRIFKNIMLCLDLVRDPDVYLAEAITMANLSGSNLHVVYHHGFGKGLREGILKDKGIEALLGLYGPKLDEELSIIVHTGEMKLKEFLRSYAAVSDIDLILGWEKPGHVLSGARFFLMLDRLARRMRCPILILYDEIKIRELKHIALPVADLLPADILLLTTRLARAMDAFVHVVGVSGGNPDHDDRMHFLLQATRHLSAKAGVQVQCSLLSGYSTTWSSLQFCRTMNGGLLLAAGERNSFFQYFVYKFLLWQSPGVSGTSVMIVPGTGWRIV